MPRKSSKFTKGFGALEGFHAATPPENPEDSGKSAGVKELRQEDEAVPADSLAAVSKDDFISDVLSDLTPAEEPDKQKNSKERASVNALFKERRTEISRIVAERISELAPEDQNSKEKTKRIRSEVELKMWGDFVTQYPTESEELARMKKREVERALILLEKEKKSVRSDTKSKKASRSKKGSVAQVPTQELPKPATDVWERSRKKFSAVPTKEESPADDSPDLRSEQASTTAPKAPPQKKTVSPEQKIYSDFVRDPIFKSLIKSIDAEIDVHSAQLKRGPNLRARAQDVEHAVAREKFMDFFMQYPEKAKAYAEQGHPGLKYVMNDALVVREERMKAEEAKRLRILQLRKEIETFNVAVQQNTVTELMKTMGVDNRYTVAERRAFVESEVEKREREIEALERSGLGTTDEAPPAPDSPESDGVRVSGNETSSNQAPKEERAEGERPAEEPSPAPVDESVNAETPTAQPEDETRSTAQEDSAVEESIPDPVSPDTVERMVAQGRDADERLNPELVFARRETGPDLVPDESFSAKPDDSKLSPEALSAVAESLFEKHFRIRAEDLERIEGYAELSEAQRRMVFENLREYEDRGRAPLLGFAWEAVLQGFGNSVDTSVVRGAKGIKEYRHVLEPLIQSMATNGPKMYEKDGELLPPIVDIDREGKREHRLKLIEAEKEFNATAHQLGRTPLSWLEDGIGTHGKNESRVMKFFKDRFSKDRKKYNIYQERQSEYIDAKQKLSDTLRTAGFSEAEIVTHLVQADQKVFELQFVHSSPDEAAVIQSIPDAGFWKNVGKSFFSKKGMASNAAYFGLGYVSKSIVAGASTTLGVPAAAAAFAGAREWNKTAAELRERDRAARTGTADTSAEAASIVQTEQKVMIGGKEQEVGIVGKLRTAIESFRQADMRLAEALPGSDEKTIAQLQTERARSLERLNNRATYAHDKLKLNRINFGDSSVRAVRTTEFFEALALAQVLVHDGGYVGPHARVGKGGVTMPTTEERITSFFSKKEDAVHDRRRKLQRKRASWKALLAGSLTLAGAQIAERYGDAIADKLGFGAVTAPATSPDAPPILPDFPDVSEAIVSEETMLRTEAGSDAPYAAEAHSQSAPYDNLTDMAEETVVVAEDASADVAEAPEVSAESLGEYSIQKGDTLWGIMKTQIPEIAALTTEKAKDNAIANILDTLSIEDLEAAGIRSGDVNRIYAGETLNLDVLHGLVAEQEAYLERAESRFGTSGSEPIANDVLAAAEDASDDTSEVRAPAHEDVELSKIIGEDTTLDQLKAMNGIGEGVAPDVSVAELDNASVESAPASEADTNVADGIVSADAPVVSEVVETTPSPYGVESTEMIRFREAEANAFVQLTEVGFMKRLATERSMSAQGISTAVRAGARALQMHFETFALAMDATTPHFSSEGSVRQIKGHLSPEASAKAAQYLFNRIQEKEGPYYATLKEILKNRMSR